MTSSKAPSEPAVPNLSQQGEGAEPSVLQVWQSCSRRQPASPTAGRVPRLFRALFSLRRGSRKQKEIRKNRTMKTRFSFLPVLAARRLSRASRWRGPPSPAHPPAWPRCGQQPVTEASGVLCSRLLCPSPFSRHILDGTDATLRAQRNKLPGLCVLNDELAPLGQM